MTPDRPDETLAPLLHLDEHDIDRAYDHAGIIVDGLLEELIMQRRLSAEKDATIADQQELLDARGRQIKAQEHALAEQSATLARLEQERDEAREHEH